MNYQLRILIFFLLCCLGNANAESVFPGNSWLKYDNAKQAGFSSKKLQAAQNYTKTINTAAVILAINGKIVAEWGDVEHNFKTHSIRKSFLSALYGKQVKSGVIDLDKTMKELGINDNSGLSEIELKATIRDLIKARSGIYHPALYESRGMKKRKPPRHSQKPGTHWYYNNWDFNVAGTLYERLSGQKIFSALKKEIAVPIGMEHFKEEEGTYITGDESQHAAYPFRISARDLARFGVLMLNKGNWNGSQIIAPEWVEESTRYHSDASLYSADGYGYMWWVARDNNKFEHFTNVDIPEGSFSARGAGGHVLLIIPKYNMVFVHRVDTDKHKNRVSKGEVGKLIKLVLDAKITPDDAVQQ